MNKTLLLFGFIIMFSMLLFQIFVSEEVVIGEKLCVDGNNNRNLEGIMCEETGYQYFGLYSPYDFYIILAVLFFVVIAMIFVDILTQQDNYLAMKLKFEERDK